MSSKRTGGCICASFLKCISGPLDCCWLRCTRPIFAGPYDLCRSGSPTLTDDVLREIQRLPLLAREIYDRDELMMSQVGALQEQAAAAGIGECQFAASACGRQQSLRSAPAYAWRGLSSRAARSNRPRDCCWLLLGFHEMASSIISHRQRLPEMLAAAARPGFRFLLSKSKTGSDTALW